MQNQKILLYGSRNDRRFAGMRNFALINNKVAESAITMAEKYGVLNPCEISHKN